MHEGFQDNVEPALSPNTEPSPFSYEGVNIVVLHPDQHRIDLRIAPDATILAEAFGTARHDDVTGTLRVRLEGSAERPDLRGMPGPALPDSMAPYFFNFQTSFDAGTICVVDSSVEMPSAASASRPFDAGRDGFVGKVAIHPDQVAGAREKFRELVQRSGPMPRTELIVRHADGKRVRAKITKVFEFTGLGTLPARGVTPCAPSPACGGGMGSGKQPGRPSSPAARIISPP